jgi:hypothetical protein
MPAPLTLASPARAFLGLSQHIGTRKPMEFRIMWETQQIFMGKTVSSNLIKEPFLLLQ